MAGDDNENRAERSEKAQESRAVEETGDIFSRQALAELKETSKSWSETKAAGKDSGSIEIGKDGEVVQKNADGRITSVEHTNGTRFDYDYDAKGNLKKATISGADGDADYWVKLRDGQWKSYDKYYGPGDARNKAGNLVLRGGDWEVNKEGRMYHSSGEVTQVAEKRVKR